MEYMSYYENSSKIQKSDYHKMKRQILENHANNFHKLTIRKQDFVNVKGYISPEEELPQYHICMKNQDRDFIYIEKKNIQNQVIYKNCSRISAEEYQKIAAGDIGWMKESSHPLINDVYRQITINGMELGGIKEYTRTVYQCGRDKRIVFDTKVQRIIGKGIGLLGQDGIYINCLFDNHVIVSYRRDKTIPRMIANMIQSQEQVMGDFAFA